MLNPSAGEEQVFAAEWAAERRRRGALAEQKRTLRQQQLLAESSPSPRSSSFSSSSSSTSPVATSSTLLLRLFLGSGVSASLRLSAYECVLFSSTLSILLWLSGPLSSVIAALTLLSSLLCAVYDLREGLLLSLGTGFFSLWVNFLNALWPSLRASSLNWLVVFHCTCFLVALLSAALLHLRWVRAQLHSRSEHALRQVERLQSCLVFVSSAVLITWVSGASPFAPFVLSVLLTSNLVFLLWWPQLAMDSSQVNLMNEIQMGRWICCVLPLGMSIGVYHGVGMISLMWLAEACILVTAPLLCLRLCVRIPLMEDRSAALVAVLIPALELRFLFPTFGPYLCSSWLSWYWNRAVVAIGFYALLVVGFSFLGNYFLAVLPSVVSQDEEGRTRSVSRLASSTLGAGSRQRRRWLSFAMLCRLCIPLAVMCFSVTFGLSWKFQLVLLLIMVNFIAMRGFSGTIFLCFIGLSSFFLFMFMMKIFGFLHIQIDQLGVQLSMFSLTLLLLVLYLCTMFMVYVAVFGHSPGLNSCLAVLHALLLTFIENMLYLSGVYPLGMLLVTLFGGAAMCFGSSMLFRESIETSLLGLSQLSRATKLQSESSGSSSSSGARVGASLLRSLAGCIHLSQLVVLVDPSFTWLAQLSVALLLFVVMAAIAFSSLHRFVWIFQLSIFIVALVPLRIAFLGPLFDESWDEMSVFSLSLLIASVSCLVALLRDSGGERTVAQSTRRASMVERTRKFFILVSFASVILLLVGPSDPPSDPTLSATSNVVHVHLHMDGAWTLGWRWVGSALLVVCCAQWLWRHSVFRRVSLRLALDALFGLLLASQLAISSFPLEASLYEFAVLLLVILPACLLLLAAALPDPNSGSVRLRIRLVQVFWFCCLLSLVLIRFTFSQVVLLRAQQKYRADLQVFLLFVIGLVAFLYAFISAVRYQATSPLVSPISKANSSASTSATTPISVSSREVGILREFRHINLCCVLALLMGCAVNFGYLHGTSWSLFVLVPLCLLFLREEVAPCVGIGGRLPPRYSVLLLVTVLLLFVDATYLVITIHLESWWSTLVEVVALLALFWVQVRFLRTLIGQQVSRAHTPQLAFTAWTDWVVVIPVVLFCLLVSDVLPIILLSLLMPVFAVFWLFYASSVRKAGLRVL